MTAPLGMASSAAAARQPFPARPHRDAAAPGAEVISIGAIRDWLAPLSTTILDGVRHIKLPTDHSGLLVDAEVAEGGGRACWPRSRALPAERQAELRARAPDGGSGDVLTGHVDGNRAPH